MNKPDPGRFGVTFSPEQMTVYQQCFRAAVAEERERCAVIAELHNDPKRSADGWEKGYNQAAEGIAAAIRKG